MSSLTAPRPSSARDQRTAGTVDVRTFEVQMRYFDGLLHRAVRHYVLVWARKPMGQGGSQTPISAA